MDVMAGCPLLLWEGSERSLGGKSSLTQPKPPSLIEGAIFSPLQNSSPTNTVAEQGQGTGVPPVPPEWGEPGPCWGQARRAWRASFLIELEFLNR